MNISAGNTFHLYECRCDNMLAVNSLFCFSKPQDALEAIVRLELKARQTKTEDGPREHLYYGVHLRVGGKDMHVVHVRKNTGQLPWEVKYKL